MAPEQSKLPVVLVRMENNTALAIKLHENLTLEQRVAFAILCAKATTRSKKFHRWADRWIKQPTRRSKLLKHEPKAAKAGIALFATAAALRAARYWMGLFPACLEGRGLLFNDVKIAAIEATTFALDAGVDVERLLPKVLK